MPSTSQVLKEGEEKSGVDNFSKSPYLILKEKLEGILQSSLNDQSDRREYAGEPINMALAIDLLMDLFGIKDVPHGESAKHLSIGSPEYQALSVFNLKNRLIKVTKELEYLKEQDEVPQLVKTALFAAYVKCHDANYRWLTGKRVED